MRSISGSRLRPAAGLILTLSTGLAAAAVAPLAATAAPSDDALVISEVYGGGGNNGSTYTHDFVELHNPTGDAISVEGMSVQYRSAGAAAGTSPQVTTLTGSVPAGGHFLVQQGKGAGGSTPLPAPDATGSISMSATGGVVFLVDGTSGVRPPLGDVRATDPGPGEATVDLVGFGSANTYENQGTQGALGTPAPSNTNAVARTAGLDTDDNSADFTTAAPAPQNSGGDGDTDPEPPAPPAPATPRTIAQIQGTGAGSPLAGERAETTGVVTAAYPTSGLDGFFLQTAGTGDEPVAERTGSEALFVHGTGALAGMAAGVEVGDHVEVTGTVSERFGVTTLTPASGAEVTELAEPASVTPTATAWPATDAARERLEGMLLAPQGDFTVSDNFSLNQYAEIGLAQGTEPLRQPTDVAVHGTEAAAAVAADNAARKVILDDGASTNFLSDTGEDIPLPYLTADPTIRVGESVEFVRPVVLDHGFNAWRFQPTEQLDAADSRQVLPATFGDTRTAKPADVGGDLQVASFNVLNYFTTLGEDLPGCRYYFERNETDPVTVRDGCDARGAAEAEDFERQQAKIVRAINALGAEVVSLSEIENSAKFDQPRDTALAALVEALNADLGAAEWEYVPTPADAPDPAGEDVIRNALIYKPAAVEPVGESAIRPSTSDDDPFVNARDPLAQVFAPVGAIEDDRFMLVVNHFKSKGSAPSSGENADTGQGGWNARRTEQARALAAWTEQLRTERGVEKVYLDGDFNSYTFEDPMLALYEAGYTNLDEEFDGGESYLFGGLVGSLDHGLVNDAALASTTGSTIWNINSVESIALEYSRYNYNVTPFYDATTPYRASDHDPVIFGIDTTPVADEQVATTLSAKATPRKVTVNKTRPMVHATVTAEDGSTVEGGTVTVSQDDEVLGSGVARDGTANVRIPAFDQAGRQELTVSYTGGDQGGADLAGSTATISVDVAKQRPTSRLTVRPGRVVADRTRPIVRMVLEADGQRVTGQAQVRAQGRSWTSQARNGVVELRLPVFRGTGKRTVTVSYLGDGENQPLAATRTIQVRKR